MPWARAAVTQPISHGTMGARPGVILARVSLARSLVPMTKAVSLVSTSLAAAAISPALSIASGVSIIAQMRIFWSALMSTRRSATSSRWPGVDTFGTSTASGFALAAALRSSQPPFGVEAVDANDDLARAEPAGAHGIQHLLAGGGLAIRGDGVLEIEDDGVGRQRARLLDGAGIGAGHVQHAPARANGHVDVPSYSTLA